MAAIGTFQTGALSNQVICQVAAATPGATTGAQYAIGAILTARYHFTAGAGTSAGTGTFQELGGDGVWRAMQDVTALSFTAAGEFAGILNGPFHGIRLSLGAITGGTITFGEIIGATLT